MSPTADERTTRAVQLCLTKKISAKEAIRKAKSNSSLRNVQKRVKKERERIAQEKERTAQEKEIARLALGESHRSRSSGEDADDNTTPAAMQNEARACRALMLLTNGENCRDGGEGEDDETPAKAQRKPHKQRYHSTNKRPYQVAGGHRDNARRKLVTDSSFMAATTE